MEALVKKIRKVQNPDATKYKWKNMCLICQIVRLTGMRILVMCAFSWNKSVEFQAVHIKFNIEEDFLDSQVKVNHASEKRTNRNLRKKKLTTILMTLLREELPVDKDTDSVICFATKILIKFYSGIQEYRIIHQR